MSNESSIPAEPRELREWSGIGPREYKEAAQQWTSSVIGRLARRIHPVLDAVGTEDADSFEEAEGHEAPEDAALRSPLYRPVRVSHEWTVNVQTSIDFDLDTFLSELYRLADDFGGQLSEGLLGFIRETAEATGQVVERNDGDLYDSLVEAVEKLEFSFDDEGNHGISFVMHPDLAGRLTESPPTKEQEARMAEIIERKREEWNASRARLDLP